MTSELETLCESKGLTISSLLVRKPTDRNAKGDDWKASAYEFACVLTYQGRTMQVPYWMGHGHETLPQAMAEDIAKCPRSIHAERVRNQYTIAPKPSAADVLSSLILDASACDQTFDDWCSDFGYDTDSMKANALYLECQRIGKQVRKFLGSDFATFQDAEH